MANEQFDEHEQGERVRNWLQQNGSSLIGGVALGLACLGGYQWWQNRQDSQRGELAVSLQAYHDAVEAEDAAKADALANQFLAAHPGTRQATMIRLQQSQRLAEQGKFDEALAELDAIDGAGSDAETRALVSLRAARLLLWTAKHDEAIRRLDAPTREVFPGLASEIEGDALSAQGKRDEARAAYEAALTHLDAGSPYRAQVVLKLIEAGGQIPDETQTGT